MRIALIAPLYEPIPPVGYGGTERVVSVLCEQLVKRGHEVVLFASGDSQTSAELVACAPQSIRALPDVRDPIAYHVLQLRRVYARAAAFDLIHNHTTYQAFPFAEHANVPTLTTVHGRIDLPEYRLVLGEFGDQPLVAISRAQMNEYPGLNWRAVVYNGVDLTRLTFRQTPDADPYLVFLGRMSPEKRPDRAIEIARELDMRIVLAAKVDRVDEEYFKYSVLPLIRNYRGAEFIGEVSDIKRDELLGGAYACLFPVDWPEPFGLTMVESMATGTPVVASRRGAVAEVLEDGVTGMVCDSLRAMLDAVPKVGKLDRRACRERVERLFSADAMTTAYERVYAELRER